MTEKMELMLSRLPEIPGENLAPEPYGRYLRLLAGELEKALFQTGYIGGGKRNDRDTAILLGHFDEKALEDALMALPEGTRREVLFAMQQELSGLLHRYIALDEERVSVLVGLFLEMYGAFCGEELPEEEALLRDFRSYALDYLPDHALDFVRRELDLFEEAAVPAAPSGTYQEHLLAEAAAAVGNWRMHLTNANQTIIGKETAFIAADPETLPVAAYVRRLLRGLGVRSCVLVRPPELTLAAPWSAECEASSPRSRNPDAGEGGFEEAALAYLPAEKERSLSLILDEAYVSRRLRAEEEALREVGEIAFDGHVGTLRLVPSFAEDRKGRRYFSDHQRELYLSLCRELSAIRGRYMKVRPFLCAVSVRERF